VADSTLGFELDGGTLPAVREEDAAFVEGLCAGTEAAYEALILRYEQPVYSIVSRLVENVADAPDVVQEVFLKIFRNIETFRGESQLKTWIYRIAVNEARNYRRWFGRHRRQEVVLEAASSGWSREDQFNLRDVLPDPAPSPYQVALDGETQALIEEAMASLSTNYRAALVLREVEGLSYEEIAAILEISLGTVKSRILRGREALRRAVTERLEAGSRQWSPQFGAQGTQTV
jgi:RNA polymerase sigma-70 factor, ECF subfamily